MVASGALPEMPLMFMVVEVCRRERAEGQRYRIINCCDSQRILRLNFHPSACAAASMYAITGMS